LLVGISRSDSLSVCST